MFRYKHEPESTTCDKYSKKLPYLLDDVNKRLQSLNVKQQDINTEERGYCFYVL